jgi:hypothetical protein
VRNAHLLAAAIPAATLEVLPGVGHAYLLEEPEQSHRLFSSWLRERSPVPAGRPLSAAAARVEPVTRHLGLAVGTFRTGRSLVAPFTERRPAPPRSPGRRGG